ncbi:MAG TPA: hypothetical protein VK177_21680 [Flavobacteriales bacterium]|nr:hypothetical protein [Flavobacteriales bacterium]
MEKEIATPNNFKEYWNLNIVAEKPIQWYLEHPKMNNYIGLYTGEKAFDENSVQEIKDFLRSNELKELNPLFMYFLAHAISLQTGQFMDKEDKSFIGFLFLSDQTEAFCDFFQDESAKKKRVLSELIHCVAWSFMADDSWEEQLDKYRNGLYKSQKLLNESNTLFLDNCFERIKNSCLLQL